MSFNNVNVTHPNHEPVKVVIGMGAAVLVSFEAENETLANVLQFAADQLPGGENIRVTTLDADGNSQLAAETHILRPQEGGGYSQITGTPETPVQPGDRVTQTQRVSNGS